MKFILRPMWLIPLGLVAIGAAYVLGRANYVSQEMLAVYQFVEQHPIELETRSHRDAVEFALSLSPIDIAKGVYVRGSELDGNQATGTWHFGRDGSYRYSLEVGDRKTAPRMYEYTGRWWMHGRVLYTKFESGNKFLLVSESSPGDGTQRAIVQSADTGSLVLLCSERHPITLSRTTAAAETQVNRESLVDCERCTLRTGQS